MSWQCGSNTNEGLVQNLYKNKLIKTPFIRDAMLKVDRKNYLRLPGTFSEAYSDTPLPLNDLVTISAPHMHAMALEYLAPQLQKPNCRCLDVGSGSGYLVACMLHCILANQNYRIEPEKVRVVGVEYLEEIAEHSKEALRKDLNQSVNDERVHSMYRIFHGDGWTGCPEYAPYDAIHVGAAAAEIPKKLVDQLAPGGRMVIPIGPQYSFQYLCLVDKNSEGKVTIKEVADVRYVPLVNPNNEPEYVDPDAKSENMYL
jgi:protein-L-isoaspartate(D-aspartate) O-methyltransferase